MCAACYIIAGGTAERLIHGVVNCVGAHSGTGPLGPIVLEAFI